MITPLPLQFSVDELSPFVSSDEVSVHYDVYTTNYFSLVNNAILGTKYQEYSMDDLLKDRQLQHSDSHLYRLINQAHNHDILWQSISPISKTGEPSTNVQSLIRHSFGSTESMARNIIDHADQLFGSGWIWLVLAHNQLHVVTTPNSAAPFDGVAVWACDLWEHAFVHDVQYINEQRSKYVENMTKLINWNYVNKVCESNGN